MTASHTPGPWHSTDNLLESVVWPQNGSGFIASIPQFSKGYGPTKEVRKANAHLIAAAPEMADSIHDIYSWMLCTLPLDLRLRAQAELAALRDAYAKATNRDAEEVQNEHEEAAALSRATGAPTP